MALHLVKPAPPGAEEYSDHSKTSEVTFGLSIVSDMWTFRELDSP